MAVKHYFFRKFYYHDSSFLNELWWTVFPKKINGCQGLCSLIVQLYAHCELLMGVWKVGDIFCKKILFIVFFWRQNVSDRILQTVLMTCFLAEFLCCNLADNRNKFIAVKLQKLFRSWKVAEFFFEMEWGRIPSY